MRNIFLLAIFPIFISGCNIKQSICVSDEKQLMKEVFVLNCLGRFDLIYDNITSWISQGLIPSKCDMTQVQAMDYIGKMYSVRQYKNDTFQAALSVQVSQNAKTLEPVLEFLSLSRKRKNETCAQQIDRHRIRRSEFEREYGSRL